MKQASLLLTPLKQNPNNLVKITLIKNYSLQHKLPPFGTIDLLNIGYGSFNTDSYPNVVDIVDSDGNKVDVMGYLQRPGEIEIHHNNDLGNNPQPLTTTLKITGVHSGHRLFLLDTNDPDVRTKCGDGTITYTSSLNGVQYCYYYWLMRDTHVNNGEDALGFIRPVRQQDNSTIKIGFTKTNSASTNLPYSNGNIVELYDEYDLNMKFIKSVLTLEVSGTPSGDGSSVEIRRKDDILDHHIYQYSYNRSTSRLPSRTEQLLCSKPLFKPYEVEPQQTVLMYIY